MIRKSSTFSIARYDDVKTGWSLRQILRHAGEVVDELGLSKSKPVSSPATADGATRCQDDELKSLGEEEKHLYQRIVAKLDYLAHDRLDLKYATSCLKASSTLLEKGTFCLAGFPFP